MVPHSLIGKASIDPLGVRAEDTGSNPVGDTMSQSFPPPEGDPQIHPNLSSHEPYIPKKTTKYVWNPDFYDQDAKCSCGHPYDRHFDSYDDMAPVGCKYCVCSHWTKPVGESQT